MVEQYTYAVARVRAKELTLLSKQDIESLLACRTYEDGLHLLAGKGWKETQKGTEAMLSAEIEETWDTIRELVDDMSVFDVFLYPIDFQNLKAAVKSVVTNSGQHGSLFLPRGTVPVEQMVKAVQTRDFSTLPQRMQSAASEAATILLQTGDGQLCDITIDRAALEAVRDAGRESKDGLIREYAELTVAVADIKMAVRGQKTGKSAAFMRKMLVACASMDVEALIHAAVAGRDEINAYLLNTRYGQAVEELKKSPSAFECWCDNRIMELIRPQKYQSFTIAPLAAYILARENEIKMVRLVLSAKRNHLKESVVRERLREMYV